MDEHLSTIDRLNKLIQHLDELRNRIILNAAGGSAVAALAVYAIIEQKPFWFLLLCFGIVLGAATYAHNLYCSFSALIAETNRRLARNAPIKKQGD